MKRVDLYSDTTTRPTEGMRRAMYAAEVGDEQRGLDPTVIRLEERVAAILEKEAALFLPSATMANQIAIKLHTEPGDEVILESLSHPAHAEAGGPGLISGVNLRPLAGDRGLFTPDQVHEAVRPDRPLFSRSRLLWVENTHNMGGGTVWPLARLRAVAAAGRAHGLRLHLDGARIFNASIASKSPAHVIAEPFDTVTVCLSKGLGAPIGGLIAGDRETIVRARRLKQALGGAMRQAGVIAAAGLFALDHHVERLAEDHRRARRLAEGLAALPGLFLDPARVETNMVFFEVTDERFTGESFQKALAERGVDVSFSRGKKLRAVTHLDIDDRDIERAIQAAAEILKG